ncbi:MAG: DUF4159 domain-containing protein [Pseudomonadota bacterium]
MSLGPLAFLNPLLLAGLLALPLIWWLLRAVPPRPRQIAFPPTRILADLENREKTPSKTPWWLMLIRMLAAALLILALAEPLLNPTQDQGLKGSGPVVIVVDNGWASAGQWAQRRDMIDRLITEAEGASRPIVIAPTASLARNVRFKIESPSDARSTAAALEPLPFAPDRMAAVKAIAATLSGRSGAAVLWLSDGVAHTERASAFADALVRLGNGGEVSIMDVGAGSEALAVRGRLGPGGKLVGDVLRAGGAPRAGTLQAVSAKGQNLGLIPFSFAAGERATSVTFDLPLELRNQVTRVEIVGERAAGAVSLLDARSQWHRVGVISGASREQAQPLLSPTYYIEKALAPFAELVTPGSANVAQDIDQVLKRRASIIMLADIGRLSDRLSNRLRAWVDKGGILLRFAGPRLEKGGDGLLPVGLRLGGRSLGGALSWSVPQPLAKFGDGSPFAGLEAPVEVKINRQVLADPVQLVEQVSIWARLKDGTPLVTARQIGEGQVVLFHITANTDWSNLPLSGLFVDMLRRITALGQLGTAGTGGGGLDTKGQNAADGDRVLPPLQVLSGFGVLRNPPPTAEALSTASFLKAKPSASHPPGYYGAVGRPRALNVIGPKAEVKPLPDLPSSIAQRAYKDAETVPLKPTMLAIALALLLADALAILLLQGGARLFGGVRRSSAAAVVIAAALGTLVGAFGQVSTDGHAPNALVSISLAPATAQAQDNAGRPDASPNAALDRRLLAATDKVTFAYVITGDAGTDQISEQGLNGLIRNLQRRTAVEPGPPARINIETDQIGLYPIIYWPVLATAKPLSDPVLAKIDAYMKQGGMIIFDTRDYGRGLPSGFNLGGTTRTPLQRMLGKLDIPRLEPVPETHVLTKSFYLLRDFPGRWSGGRLWVEVSARNAGVRRARRADGVSSILVTSNDFAAAWAMDDRGRSLYPTVPGGERQREMAFRTGINIVMYALTGNYKADQVHIPALLERLGQ